MAGPQPFHLYRPHPWHGLDTGAAPPGRVTAFIEITPFDLVKYELDKATGFLRVDRPQPTSSLPPCLYGLIPRTYCGEGVRALCPGAARADGDPLDVCVLSERPIARAEVLLPVRVVGGLQMVDQGEADDKIIAVLERDPFYADVDELDRLPRPMIERLRHYFLSYKALPGTESGVSIERVYGRAHAEAVVTASMDDYRRLFAS
ncbi:MAG: inorganic pyrophosphatase [Planctomycetota bacterium]